MHFVFNSVERGRFPATHLWRVSKEGQRVVAAGWVGLNERSRIDLTGNALKKGGYRTREKVTGRGSELTKNNTPDCTTYK